MMKNMSWLKILLIFVCLGIVISAFFRILTPQEEPSPEIPISQMVSESPEGVVSKFGNISLDTDFSPDTKNLGIYQLNILQDKSGQMSAQAVEKIISHHQLQLTHSGRETLVYGSNEHTLFVNPDTNKINFSKNNSQPEGRVDYEQAVEAASNFLEFALPDNKLKPIVNSVNYYHGELHLHPTTKNKAKFIEIPFSYYIDELPVYYFKEIKPQAVILVDTENQIEKAVLQPIYFEYEQSTTFSPITAEKAVELINQQNVAAFIKKDEDTPTPLSLEEIQEGRITQVKMEMRADPELKLIYPCYRFDGYFVDNNNQEFEATLITPALKTQSNQ